MKVVFTASAKADLEQIGDYIAQDNPQRALSFVRELRSAALMLKNKPSAFPLVSRYERQGIRRRPFRNYLIFYRVEQDRVLIVHVIHDARDYEPILFPEDDAGR